MLAAKQTSSDDRILNFSCDFLVVAGGGGGGGRGGNYGSGGGAGGLRSSVDVTGGGGSLESALTLCTHLTYVVTVGAGGSADFGISAVVATKGSDSIFHTITSLVGFESLLKRKKVFTYGLPFYAGWGLTDDRISCPRRKRKLSLTELVAGSLILYPRYLDPIDLEYCKPELLIKRIKEQYYFIEKNICIKTFYFLRNFFIRLVQKLINKRK